MKEAVIVAALRTPMGRHGGILKDVRTDDLGAYIIAKLIDQTGIVQDSAVEKSSGDPKLDQIALDQVRRWRLKRQ